MNTSIWKRMISGFLKYSMTPPSSFSNMAITTHGAATTASLPNGGEIRDIIYNYFQDEANREVQNYVLSAQVRKQADTIHLFIYSTIAIIFILFTVVRIAIDNHKSKRRLQLQLQQIQEVQEERSQAVKQAIESAESAFFVSHEYETLQRRIATGSG